MARLNAMEVTWKKLEVLGKEGLFADWRIDRNTIPEGWYFYEVRHADNDWCEPVEIALGILVNFWGTLITKEPFDLTPLGDTGNEYLDIDPETDWEYLDEYVRL